MAGSAEVPFMLRFKPTPDAVTADGRSRRLRSYGNWGLRVQTILCALAALACLVLAASGARAADKPVVIVALGDSLTAGLGLAAEDAFPAKLAKALAAKGIAATITNAGVSGDTTSGGLARLDWSVPPGTEAVILELGANDALRGLDPAVPRAALDSILRRLKERGIPVLLCGMLSPPNLGADYARTFNAIFPQLATAYDTVFYPFFLEGTVTNRRLNQGDGIHPTAAGVDVIVRGMLPKVEELIARAKAKRGT
jgi:acyl-CoA thioesterase I